MAASRSTGEERSNVFPDFKDGDVVIQLSSSRRYQLHSDVLRGVSSVLRELLSPSHRASLSASAIRKGRTVRYRLMGIPRVTAFFEQPDKSEHGDVWLSLVAIDLDGDGRPLTATPALAVENAVFPDAVFIAYDNVLGAMYNRPIDLGDWERDGLDEILYKASQITDIAESLRVEHIITSPIEATLLATGQKVYRAIANNPTAWLNFAYRVHSRPIFNEALVHAVGRYNQPQTQEAIRTVLTGPVAEVLIRKGEKMKDDLKRIQRNILSYYPPSMHRTNTLGVANLNGFCRASYANDIFWWMAVTIYRSWAADKLAIDATHHAPDFGYSVMRLIHQSGNAYLAREQLGEFLRVFPLSSKGINVIEDHLLTIKTHMKERYADPLFRKTCQLDVATHPIKHFTCVLVHFDDYPFYQDVDIGKTGIEEMQSNEDEESDGIEMNGH